MAHPGLVTQWQTCEFSTEKKRTSQQMKWAVDPRISTVEVNNTQLGCFKKAHEANETDPSSLGKHVGLDPTDPDV